MMPWTLWFTGLPASGKTTIARALRDTLHTHGVHSVLLDSDALRGVLTPSASYTEEGRDQFYSALVGLVSLLHRCDMNILIAATAPKQAYRDEARVCCAPFAEIWVRCPITVCQARDPKGLYRQAAAGTITTLPGMGTVYEPPVTPDLVLDSDCLSVSDSVSLLLQTFPFLMVSTETLP